MSSGRRKLLLADDSPTIQKVISLTFGDEDFEVVAVGDGAQAMRALAEEPPPDVVLADAVMPGPNGYELCERIKRDARLNRVPVVLLVGTFEPFNEAEARRVGADTVLTKPFQSIRNLVGKVSSLLGGESKADEPAETHAPQDEHRPEEAHARAEEAARFEADTRHVAASDESEAPLVEDPSASFADLGVDDELIEARPAEDFGAPPPFARRRTDVPAESPEPVFETNGGAHAPVAHQEEPDNLALAAEETDDREPVFAAAQTRESVLMTEPTAPRTSFDASATSVAVDDTLLDLGQLDAPAAVATAEADDFILDLDFDDAPAQSWMDSPSAFAEAAHGETAQPFESVSSFEPSATVEPSASFDSSAPQQDEAPWRDVVMQDGPQGFAFGGEESQVETPAPRGFVEPEVVPADEPVPATVESEFTDGSVEGDLARPQEPSTAGYVVSEARAGVEETPRADQLSPEVIDAIARRVVELMSDKVVREIAWEVVPELAELLIKQKLEESNRQ